MFKKREKKVKKVNLAQEDLDKKQSDDEDLEITKKNKKKLNKQYQDNQESENAIQQVTDDKLGNMHFKGTDEMLANTDLGAAVSLKSELLGKREELLAQIKNQAEHGGDLDLNQDGGKYYTGKKNQQQFINRTEDSIRKSKFNGTMGPMQQMPSNVRMTCNFDYNPELCKDYKETGQCTFGDSCLYIHDRSDYKFGWEMEAEYEKKQKQRAANGGQYAESSDDEDMQYAEQLEELQIPKECPICDNKFSEPIVTVCGHYFCENCALQHYQTSKLCQVCGVKTNGIFNDAKKDLDKLKRDRKNIIQKRNEYRVSINKVPIEENSTGDEENQEQINNSDPGNSDNDDNSEQEESNNETLKRKAGNQKEYDEDAEQLANVGKQLKRQGQGQSTFKQSNTDWNYY